MAIPESTKVSNLVVLDVMNRSGISQVGLKPACSILRRSTKTQDISIEQQRQFIEQKAREAGYYIEKEYILDGVSGKWLSQNPIFQQMINDSKSGLNRGKPIFAYDVSRAGRMKAKEKIYYEYELEKNGQKLIYLAESFKYDGSLGDDISQFFSHSNANEYSVKLSRDTLRGQKTWASMGIWVGGTPPYGTERMLIDNNGNPVRILKRGEKKALKTEHVKLVKTPDCEKYKTLHWILDQYGIRRQSITWIVNDLNTKGIPAPYGGHWTTRTISEIIKRVEFYSTGKLVWNKRSYKDCEKVSYNEPTEFVVKEGAFEPIIDKELAEKVRDRINLKAKHKVGPNKGQRKASIYCLSGLLTCAHCKGRINAYVSIRRKTLVSGEKKAYYSRYYTCTQHLKKGKSVCPKWILIPKAKLESTIICRISALLPNFEQAITYEVNQLLEDTNQAKELETLQDEVARANKSIVHLLDAIANGLSHSIANPKICELNSRIESGNSRISALRQQNIKVTLSATLTDIQKWLRNLPQIMENGSPEERNELMRIFVEGGSVDPENRTVNVRIKKIPTLESFNELLSNVGTQSMSGNGCGGWI